MLYFITFLGGCVFGVISLTGMILYHLKNAEKHEERT